MLTANFRLNSQLEHDKIRLEAGEKLANSLYGNEGQVATMLTPTVHTASKFYLSISTFKRCGQASSNLECRQTFLWRDDAIMPSRIR
jgi:hypothetical protein